MAPEEAPPVAVVLDPFKSHLVALLSIYELGPFPRAPIPRYEGPTDLQTEMILRGLAAVAQRMWRAEAVVTEFKDTRNQLDEEKAVQLEKEILDSSGSGEYAAPSQSSDEDETELNPDGTPAGDSSSSSNTTKINGTNMTISLDGLQASIDPSKFFTRAYGNMKAHQVALKSSGGYSSAPPTAHAHCPTCGKSISDPLMLYNSPEYSDMLSTSSLVVPMGPLDSAAVESRMDAVEELKLLKAEVGDIARVCSAVARGDLSQKITVPVQGVVMSQLKDVINTMVDTLVRFAKEVTRVSQEVGTEGILGGHSPIHDVEGTWRELTGIVNKLAANLTP